MPALTVNVVIGLDPALMRLATALTTTIEADLVSILANQETEMNSFEDVIAATAKETTDIASLRTFVGGLKQQIADALSGVTLPPAVQAKLDTVFTTVTANDQSVVDAMAANVPVDPTLPPPATDPNA